MLAQTVNLRLKPNSVAEFTQAIEKEVLPLLPNHELLFVSRVQRQREGHSALGRLAVLVQPLPFLLSAYVWNGGVFEAAGCLGPVGYRRSRLHEQEAPQRERQRQKKQDDERNFQLKRLGQRTKKTFPLNVS
jgi:hypothetical protein